MRLLNPRNPTGDIVHSISAGLKRLSYGILSLSASLLLSCSAIASDCPGTVQKSPSSEDWQKWVTGLKGYLVERGNTFVLDPTACKSFQEVFGTCFGANAAAPYIFLQPSVRGSFVDPFYAATFNSVGPKGVRTNIFYRLSDNDALITLVKLPPQAAYLGYGSAVFTRRTNLYANPPLSQLPMVALPNGFMAPDQPFQLVSPDRGRLEISGSVGNDVNNVIIKNQSGAAWNGATVVYVTTSNQEMAKDILANALDQCFVFVEPIGSNVVTGTGAKGDDLYTTIRYALPKDQHAATDWLNGRDENVIVYKVTNPRIPAVRFGPSRYSAKTASDEKGLQQPLDELSGLLQGWFASKFSKPAQVGELADLYRVNSQGELDGYIGSKCIANGTNCGYDNQDSAVSYGALASLRSSQSAIVTGVNHTLTDNASYLSIAVGYAPKGNFDILSQSGVASSSQTNESTVGFSFGVLNGSAEDVLRKLNLYSLASPQLQQALKFLYVSLVSRNCQKDFADVIEHCIGIDGAVVPEDSVIGISGRDYIKPGTTTGPNGSVLVNSKVIFNQ